MALSDLGIIGTGFGALTSMAGGVYGAVSGYQDQKAIAADQRAIAQTNIQENQLRRTAMEVTSRRQAMQNVRQMQYARSMALNTATNQGAQFGSALPGAYGSIAGQGNLNTQGINQNLQMGEQMFNYSDTETAQKMWLAQDQAGAAANQAFGGLLGGIGKSLGPLGNFASAIPGLLAV